MDRNLRPALLRAYGQVMPTPTTIFGWVAEGYAFESRDDDSAKDPYGYLVVAPDGSVLGEVRGESPEAAVAEACTVAGAHFGRH